MEGRYIAKNTNVGKHKSNVYIVETDNGEKVGVWGGTVIDGRFDKIAIGKKVGIEYLGEKEGKNGMYNNFWVGSGVDQVGDTDL